MPKGEKQGSKAGLIASRHLCQESFCNPDKNLVFNSSKYILVWKHLSHSQGALRKKASTILKASSSSPSQDLFDARLDIIKNAEKQFVELFNDLKEA